MELPEPRISGTVLCIVGLGGLGLTGLYFFEARTLHKGVYTTVYVGVGLALGLIGLGLVLHQLDAVLKTLKSRNEDGSGTK